MSLTNKFIGWAQYTKDEFEKLSFTQKTGRLIFVRDIENNIESLIAEGLIGDQLQERALHYSTIIYEENYWLKYNHLIAGRVDAQTYGVLDNFYKIAFKIREQQLMIKNKLLQSMDYKGMYYYNGIFSRVNGILDKQVKLRQDCPKA